MACLRVIEGDYTGLMDAAQPGIRCARPNKWRSSLLTRRKWLALAVSAPLAASKDWDQPGFPNWSDSFVERILTDSPWAQQLNPRFDLSSTVGGSRGPGALTEIYLTIRWSSALPIRQAVALERWGKDGLDKPEAMEWLGRREKDYVMEIFGFNVTAVPKGAKWLEEQLTRSASISGKGRRRQPSTVRVPEHGMHLSAELRFPRSESEFTPDEDSVRFTAEAGAIKIDLRFKLKEMVYGGKLEL
ncbi:MAG: hypothetical protein JJE04_05780 [Acidobacteriia bacterium]|nr:hypothetical protein [Terriglobia bacterium]